MHLPILRYVVVCIVGTLYGAMGHAMNTLDAQSPDTPSGKPRWSIAIHGGAGGASDKWTDERRQARREGLEKALQIGRDLLADGRPSLEAVEAVIRSLEDNARFNAGRGAVLTNAGRAELDASIMDGATAKCGAVAGVTAVQNPISLARMVMTDTPHVLLAGPGADAFAVAQNVPQVPPDYFLSYRFPGADKDDDRDDFHLGTVGCAALDTMGNLAAGTSTGGTSKKLPGRIGDSPIVGAGTFADNQTCAVSGTGIGEEFIRHAVAYDIAAQMRYAGKSLEAAVTHVMTQRLKANDGGVIGVARDGTVVMQHNTPGMSCGMADSSGRFAVFFALENGGRPFTSGPDRGTTDAPETALAAGEDPDIKEITLLIQRQQRDWNAGNIDHFMDAYWRSEELTFSSGGQVTRGWDATIARYKKRYPDAQTMGQVRFSELEFLRLDGAAMQVQGVWQLSREAEPISGRFTLIFRKQQAGWRIVHDHTSVQAD